MNIALSICIPTFNRCKELEKCIKSILSQVNLQYKERIEIIVSDNCSSDETSSLVKAFPEIKYLKQETNIGAELNILSLYQRALGKYIWILGDDEELLENALDSIMDVISNSEYDLILLNYASWSAGGVPKNLKPNFKIRARTFPNSNKLLEEIGAELSFISCVIIKRKLLEKFPTTKYIALKDTGFSFLYSIYFIIKDSNKIFFSDNIFFKNRLTDIVSYNWDNFFIKNLSMIINELKVVGYSTNSIRKANGKIIIKYIAPKFRSRIIDNIKINKSVKYTYSIFKMDYRFWICIFPLLFIPGGVLRFAKNLISKFKG